MFKSKFLLFLIGSLLLIVGIYFLLPKAPTYIIPPEITPTIQEEKTLYEQYSIKPTPSALTLIIFKKEQQSELWLNYQDTALQKIVRDTIILDNSTLGPNTFQDSTHLPEGIYGLKTAISDSCLTFLLDFPNSYDRQKTIVNDSILSAFEFTLSNCSSVSIQLSDNMLKILQFLATKIPSSQIQVIIIPNDARISKSFEYCAFCPFWIYELYGQLQLELTLYQE